MILLVDTVETLPQIHKHVVADCARGGGQNVDAEVASNQRNQIAAAHRVIWQRVLCPS